MLLLSPLVACGVPKRGGQTKYPRKTSEFGDSTAGCHGERNISQETHAREQALHYFSEVHEGNRVPWSSQSVDRCWQEGGHGTLRVLWAIGRGVSQSCKETNNL